MKGHVKHQPSPNPQGSSAEQQSAPPWHPFGCSVSPLKESFFSTPTMWMLGEGKEWNSLSISPGQVAGPVMIDMARQVDVIGVLRLRYLCYPDTGLA